MFLTSCLKKQYDIFPYLSENMKRDKLFILSALKWSTTLAWSFADESLRNDTDCMLEKLKYGDANTKKDRDLVRTVVSSNCGALQYADESFRKDKDVVMAAIASGTCRLILDFEDYLDESLTNDRDFVLFAVGELLLIPECFTQYCHDIEVVFADKSGRFFLSCARINSNWTKDKKVILAAIESRTTDSYYNSPLSVADDALKKDREVVLAAVRKDGCAIDDADESLRKDREIVLTALSAPSDSGTPPLHYVDESFKNDREVVLMAVTNNGRSLEYVNETFRKDKEIVLIAIGNFGLALEYADASFKKDREVVLAAVTRHGCSLQYADEIFWKEKELALLSVANNGHCLKYLDASFKKDRDVVLTAIQLRSWFGDTLCEADSSLRKDREIALTAIRGHYEAMKCVDSSLAENEEFALEAFSVNSRVIEHFSTTMKIKLGLD